MTHDYKAAPDDISKLNGRTFSSVDECDTVFASKLCRYMDEIQSALQLAQEAEQLRKERDELAMALKEYYIMYGDRSIISSVDDLLEKAGILND